MVDYNILVEYFNTFITFDWGNYTLTFILTLFATALAWLGLKALIGLFEI